MSSAVRPGNRIEAAYLRRAARRRPATPDSVLLLQVRTLTSSLVGAPTRVTGEATNGHK
mgnify:CR=1 FL=1